MANVERMWDFFTIIDDLIDHLAGDDAQDRAILNAFVFRVLTVCDGLEGPEGWKGIAIVANEDLPPGLEEINDQFLHEAWSGRDQSRQKR